MVATMLKSIVLRERLRRFWPTFVASSAISIVIFVVGRGKLDVATGRQAILALVNCVFLGLPLFWLFRVSIRFLAFWSQAKGYLATTVGMTLCFAFVIASANAVPKQIGMACVPLGFLGGVLGSLEAKDKRDMEG
jgi:hypothetical protein